MCYVLLCSKEFESYLFRLFMWYEKHTVNVRERQGEEDSFSGKCVSNSCKFLEPSDILLGQGHTQLLVFHFGVFSLFS